MKHVVIAAVLIGSFATACTVRNERTVVERPTPVPAATVVTTDPPPPGTTVVVPAR